MRMACVSLTFSVQPQPNSIERAKRAHNRSADNCNPLLARTGANVGIPLVLSRCVSMVSLVVRRAAWSSRGA